MLEKAPESHTLTPKAEESENRTSDPFVKKKGMLEVFMAQLNCPNVFTMCMKELSLRDLINNGINKMELNDRLLARINSLLKIFLSK